MAYLEEKKAGNKTGVYLTKNIRLNNKFRKVRVLLGYKQIKNLDKVRKSKARELERKVDELMSKEDETYSLIADSERQELERLAGDYANAFKKFDPTTKQKYLDWFLTQFTYDSNAIEGSSMSLREVGMILFDHIIPADKDLVEMYEVQNQKEAFTFINKHKGDLNLRFILNVHKKVMSKIIKDAGKIRTVRVFVRGSEIKPPMPGDVNKRLEELVGWYKSHKFAHPLVLASYVHCEFEAIHPFRDGNGRTGRLLLNFILTKNKFPPINIRNDKKREYYDALRAWDKGEKRPFIGLLVSYIKDSVDYVKGGD